MIDLAAARATFEESVDLTVGIEEEFALVDPQTLELVPRFEELRDSAAPELAEHITGELIRSEIEIVSGRGADLRDAIARPRWPAPKSAMLCWPLVRRILRICETSESTL